MKVILIDGNAVGYTGSMTRPLKTADGRYTQAIFHSIKCIWNLCLRYPDHLPLVLWDKHCQWRYDLLPEYKGQRDKYAAQKEKREIYRAQRPDIQKAFELMGVTQTEHEGYEADDIAAVYAKRIALMEDSSAVLYTGDKDWLQLVSDNVTWHSIDSDKRVSANNFEKHAGTDTVAKFIIIKALVGDTSDNISGVGGIGEVTAPILINHFGSIKEMLTLHKAVGEFDKSHLPQSIVRSRKAINSFCNNEKGQLGILLRNLKLMNLHNIKPPETGFVRTKKPSDLEGFKDFCLQLEMVSLAAKAERIITEIQRVES